MPRPTAVAWCCVLLALVLSPSTIWISASSCLGVLGTNAQRFLHYGRHRHTLIMESSPRISQRLTTEVFRIFLVEALGYPNVKIEQQSLFGVSKVVRRLSGLENKRDSAVPDTMVNLEVWVPPDIDVVKFTKVASVSDCGSITFPGRYGWFIPSSLPNVSGGVNWRYFTDPAKAQTFDITGENLQYIKKLTKKNVDSYYCSGQFCEDGLYIPPHCQKNGNSTQSCALLLAPYPEETSFLVEDIMRLKLYVRVAFLGPRLSEGVNALLRPRVALLLVTSIPGDVSTDGLMDVPMPPCQPGQNYCHYELHRLAKLAWSKIADGAKTAFEALERLEFEPYHYQELISLYRELGDVGSAACSWMQKNNETWYKWTPPKEGRKVLYIGGIFPISGYSYTSKGIVRAAQMAVEAVNKNDSILPDYVLELKVDNGQCQGDVVMKTFIDYIRLDIYRQLVGILGPACSDTVEPLAGITRHFKTVVISYSAEGASFSDREKYPYFFRTIGENKQYMHVYPQLMAKLGWKRVATLTEDGQKYTEYIAHLQDELQTKHNAFVYNKKFPRERHPRAMYKYLEDIKNNNVRIIIVDVYDQAARDIMCEAYRLKMTAKQGYVWFLPLWLSPSWYFTTVYNSTLYNNTSEIRDDDINCTTAEMLEAINGHLSLSHAFFAPDGDIMQEGRSVGEWYESYTKKCKASNVTPSNYGGYAYDAVWTYAYALHKLATENQTYLQEIHFDSTTRRYVKLLETTDFFGVSGRVRFMGGGPSRVSHIHVVQWLNNRTRVVGVFQPHEHTLHTGEGRLDLNVSAIEWLTSDGKPPVDGTEPPARCVLSGLADLLNVSCEVAIVVANIIGFGLLGLLLVIGFFIVKRRYERRVRRTEDYMKSLGIDLLVTSDLDKWEIPRDHVVINRKLGEGAFGTVYGGEAHFTDKGWVAVAVKTLKVGSTTEEKLDFLSEAEVMKRFEHKNIVKLLGVCTKNEPVYTVMEFMLYGDLKTYLLARRHLVNDKITEESDDISSKKLTSMALDVARALSYLAQLKYVHRDLASRNCLVNAARTVKLGDFGMTRAMFENDYYKFNRRGMLPVRWMAPESLELGIFTPASDVWSFGVLLYEIITFGSFPFQGLSNSEVLEYVKTGNTLDVPSGVRPQLEGLIRSCWKRDYKRRPHASEIVEFLANNPRLIAPCLDAPAAAVQTDDAGSALGLGMVLPSGGGNSLRKFSLPPGVSNQSGVVTTCAEDNDTRASVIGGVHEPLLGHANSASSLSRYVTMQRGDSEYCNNELPHAVSML